MPEEIALGGFGGQGVLFIGRLLVEAAFREGREVVFMPSYGAEKRGGNVWCHVTISDEKIGALFITRPTIAVAMNLTSLAKLEPVMKADSLLVVNRSLIPSKVSREDISVVYVPANELATELGDNSVGNLVVLGALLARRPVVAMSSLIAVMDGMLSKNQARLEMNKRALNQGHAWVQRDYTSVQKVEGRG